LGGVYTPQMVVDGPFEFVGSDERRASQAVREAAMAPKVPVHVLFGSGDATETIVHVEAGPLPSSIATQPAGVFLAIADNADESQVSRGENAGRTLQHVAVLRNLIRIGAVDETAAFSRNVKVDLNSRDLNNLRIVVIVQEAKVGRVLGAGFARLARKADAIGRRQNRVWSEMRRSGVSFFSWVYSDFLQFCRCSVHWLGNRAARSRVC
jgi:hypothetical protein